MSNNLDGVRINSDAFAGGDPNSTDTFQTNTVKTSILTKLFIFGTVMLWESCSELLTMKLSHSITVSNMNSLVNMDVVTV